MDYIKQYYDLPFLEKGMKVEADGKSGKINREKNGYLEIKFDSGLIALAHPTWEMVYYNEKGEIIKDFRKRKSTANFQEFSRTSSSNEEFNTGASFFMASVVDAGQEFSQNVDDHFSGFGSEDGGSFGPGGASGSWDSGSSDYSSSDSSSDSSSYSD